MDIVDANLIVHARKAHLPPGSLVYTGEHRTAASTVTAFTFSEKGYEELTLDSVVRCKELRNESTTTWINVNGLTEIETIETLGRDFGIHSLVLEDILNTSQRPKFQNHEDYLFVVVKMLTLEQDALAIDSEQVSIIVGRNFVITFQERPGDVFDGVRDRIRRGKGQLRGMGPDYLAYALLDAIVDNYFVMLEMLGEEADATESELAFTVDDSIRNRIHTMKRLMISLRRAVWPLREVVSGMERSESDLIAKRTRIYIRDLYDHTVQVIDTVESLRDIAHGMLDAYLSSVSNRMNSIMKVLTIIATIFIPLTFVAGVYGMNFKYMPERDWVWGYPLTLLLMLLIASAMLLLFRRRKWI